MYSEETLFPDEIDKLMYWSDADLDDVQTINSFQRALANKNYRAYDILENNSVFYFGAWVINKFVNRLKAIAEFIPTIYKPKATKYDTVEPDSTEVRPEVQVMTDDGYTDGIVWIDTSNENVLNIPNSQYGTSKYEIIYNSKDRILTIIINQSTYIYNDRTLNAYIDGEVNPGDNFLFSLDPHYSNLQNINISYSNGYTTGRVLDELHSVVTIGDTFYDIGRILINTSTLPVGVYQYKLSLTKM